LEISRIYLKNDDGVKAYVDTAILDVNVGIIGNPPKNSARQVSIFSEEGRVKLEEIDNKSLCSLKFHENLTIKNLDITDFMIGDKIKFGDSVLKITELGKACFNDCFLFRVGNPCPLSKGVIFANVILGGEIRVGEKMIKL